MSPSYWLFKSEPGAYSFDDLVRDGDAEWDGVRNYQARNLLRDDIKAGDGVLFYHSGTDPLAIVGTATVVRDGYPDHTALDSNSEHPDPKSSQDNPIWYMVDIKAMGRFVEPVTLEAMRAVPKLSNMVLLKRSRLSVQPVTAEEWEVIRGMSELQAVNLI